MYPCVSNSLTLSINLKIKQKKVRYCVCKNDSFLSSFGVLSGVAGFDPSVLYFWLWCLQIRSPCDCVLGTGHLSALRKDVLASEFSVLGEQTEEVKGYRVIAVSKHKLINPFL